MNLKILIAGDYCPIGRSIKSIQEGRGNELFGEFKLITTQADFSIANLEAPLTNANNLIDKSGPNIKASIDSLKPLKEIGFDAVTLANNHILDFGKEGLISTLDVCKKEGVKFVGANLNINEARKPLLFNLKNKNIAIINIAENEFCAATESECGANPLNVITNHYDIKKAKEDNDYVLVISHGGREHYQLPSPQLRERYRFFIESGADAVIGHHTHCFSGFEYYNNKPIFYSLGNFIFDYKKKYQTGLWTQGYGVMLNLKQDKIDFDIIPFNQGRKKNPKLELLNEEERSVFDKRLNELNAIISNDELFDEAWKNYIETQKKIIQSQFVYSK